MKIQKIIEFTPIQIKKILEEYLKKDGFIVRTIKFSTNGAIAYIVEIETKGIRDYKNEKIWDLPFSVRICNSLKAVGIECLYQLEDFLKKQIANNPKWGKEKTRGRYSPIRNFGLTSYSELLRVIDDMNLQIKEDGTIARVS
ncbi:MAG: hypothetical protein WCG45_05520 [bacterium]